jgi:lipid II:glycine glycyltransferase (peptidoglycan interpeptide bridge formation enzyme)
MLLYGAYVDDHLIAGALNFVASKTTVLSFYIAMDYSYQQLRPINLLNYFFVRDAQQRGFKYLDLGVSHETNTTNPMDPRVSLIRFKEHFGAKGQLRTRLKKLL